LQSRIVSAFSPFIGYKFNGSLIRHKRQGFDLGAVVVSMVNGKGKNVISVTMVGGDAKGVEATIPDEEVRVLEFQDSAEKDGLKGGFIMSYPIV
jgi:hypothetical protein